MKPTGKMERRSDVFFRGSCGMGYKPCFHTDSGYLKPVKCPLEIRPAIWIGVDFLADFTNSCHLPTTTFKSSQDMVYVNRVYDITSWWLNQPI